jgi:hypothetical protein
MKFSAAKLRICPNQVNRFYIESRIFLKNRNNTTESDPEPYPEPELEPYQHDMATQHWRRLAIGKQGRWHEASDSIFLNTDLMWPKLHCRTFCSDSRGKGDKIVTYHFANRLAFKLNFSLVFIVLVFSLPILTKVTNVFVFTKTFGGNGNHGADSFHLIILLLCKHKHIPGCQENEKF